MPIKKLTVDERISDWVYATNDIIDELNNGVGNRQNLVTQSKVIVSALNSVGGEDFFDEVSLQADSVNNVKIQDDAVSSTKIEENIEFRGMYGRLPTGSTADRPYQGSVSSSSSFNGNQDEVFLITGKNFDTVVDVKLIATDASEIVLPQTHILRRSSELIRIIIPQDLDPTLKPYTVEVTNTNYPGSPTVSAIGVMNFGGGPVWMTSGVVVDFYDYQSHLDGFYQAQITAEDPDGAELTYTQLTGTLPAGASISTAGVVSIPECPPQYVNANSPSTYNFTVSADDGVNPPVNSNNLQLLVRPQNPWQIFADPNIQMIGWYDGSSFNGTTWQDMSGKGNHATVHRGSPYAVGSWTKGDAWGTDGSRAFPHVTFAQADGLLFPAAMTSSNNNYTAIYVARYNYDTRDTWNTGTNANGHGRILNASSANFVIGFHDGEAGVTHANHWVTSQESRERQQFDYDVDWVISGINFNVSIFNGRKMSFRGGAETTASWGQLGINENDAAWPGGTQNTDCAVAEVIIFDSKLSETQILQVQKYLSWKYGIPLSADIGDVPRVSIIGMPENRTLEHWDTDTYFTINWAADIWLNGNINYQPSYQGVMPEWLDGMLGTLNINTENNHPSVNYGDASVHFIFDRPTRVYCHREATWNDVEANTDGTWTRRTDLDHVWTNGTTAQVYEKVFQAGNYVLDTYSAMYSFADPETDASAVQWTYNN